MRNRILVGLARVGRPWNCRAVIGNRLFEFLHCWRDNSAYPGEENRKQLVLETSDRDACRVSGPILQFAKVTCTGTG